MMGTGIRLFVTGLGLVAIIVTCAPAPRYTSDQKPPPPRTTPRPERTQPTRPTPAMHARPGMIFVGVASFYGTDFHGKLTANGEVFDMYGLTAAHRSLPLNTIIRVTNLTNGRSLIVRINDRGPYIPGRMLDLSYGAAMKLGFLEEGTTRVRVEVIEVGDDEYMQHLPQR